MAGELPMPDSPLANDSVALRAWSERDIPFIVAAYQDPLIERFTAAIPSPYGEPDARAWLASQELARRAGVASNWRFSTRRPPSRWVRWHYRA